MTQAMGMTDFFAMEAGEYLERLDALVSPSTPPDAAEFVRLARALRGAALMASQKQIATVSAALEALARSYRETTVGWDETVRQVAIGGVDDLKVLVRATNNWTAGEDSRAQAITAELERVAGRAVPQAAPRPQGIDAGTRAFIAREGAAVGSALHQAAQTLAHNPGALNSLDAVLHATQPLRGIASLSDLPPLPDLLAGIERAMQELNRRKEPIPNPGEVFEAAAKAITRASQEIATHGQASADTPEAQEFAGRLGTLLGMGSDVVLIDALFHDDAGPHVVSEGSAPGPESAPGQLELVSLADHCRQVADEVEGAQTSTQRLLRVQTLAPTFRALATAGGTMTQLVNTARGAISRGMPTNDPVGFAATLRQAGNILTTVNPADEASMARLQPIIQAFAVPGAPVAAIPTPPTVAPLSVAPVSPPTQPAVIPQAAPQPQPVPLAPIQPIPIAQPATPQVPAAPIATPVPVPIVTATGNTLADAFTVYQRLMAGGGAAAQPAAVVPTQPGPAITQQQTPQSTFAPISQYCYSAEDALRRVLELRNQIRATGPASNIDLVEEILDLVDLGLG